jgi:hypothetical protein
MLQFLTLALNNNIKALLSNENLLSETEDVLFRFRADLWRYFPDMSKEHFPFVKTPLKFQV